MGWQNMATTDKKAEDESRKNCKDSPDAEGIGNGSNP